MALVHSSSLKQTTQLKTKTQTTWPQGRHAGGILLEHVRSVICSTQHQGHTSVTGLAGRGEWTGSDGAGSLNARQQQQMLLRWWGRDLTQQGRQVCRHTHTHTYAYTHTHTHKKNTVWVRLGFCCFMLWGAKLLRREYQKASGFRFQVQASGLRRLQVPVSVSVRY